MANATKTFDAVDFILIAEDLMEVKLTLKKLENDQGKMVDHIIANWPEAVKGINEAMTAFEYKAGTGTKVQEVNKFFSPQLFVAGIAQRKDWIKAGVEKQIEALKMGLAHPVMYKAEC